MKSETIYYLNKTKYIIPRGVYDYRESVASDMADLLDTWEVEGKNSDERQRLINVAIHLRARTKGKIVMALQKGFYTSEREAIQNLKGNEELIRLARAENENPQIVDMKIREFLLGSIEVQNLAEFKIKQKIALSENVWER